MALIHRKATRYAELSKAREEIARLFPLALQTIEGILRHRKAPRNLRFEAARLVLMYHLGKPPTTLDIDFQGEVTSLTHADRIAKAAAEARKAFRQALEEANGLSGLDSFPSREPRSDRPEAADGQAGAS